MTVLLVAAPHSNPVRSGGGGSRWSGDMHPRRRFPFRQDSRINRALLTGKCRGEDH
jgi:hypothetical protein